MTTLLPWSPGGTPPVPDVSIVRAPTYDAAALDGALVDVLAPLGGIRAFVSRGTRVLLKPNLLNAARPHRAVTTHPQVVAAVARAVLDAGGHVTIGDSPPGAVEGIARHHARSGLDVIISLAKLKTHTLTLLTGAVKNIYGTQPGFAKGTWHTRYPRPSDFVEVLLDLASLVAPALTIVDAIDCMEGEGPSGGPPVHRGRLVAGRDALAVEAACAPILDVRPHELPVIDAANRRGTLPAFVHVAGPLGHDAPRPARRPSYWAARHIPRGVAPLLQRALWVKARIDATRCTRCAACVPVCPTGALRLRENAPPAVDAAACIGCLVCSAACCDQAIGWRFSPVARWVV